MANQELSKFNIFLKQLLNGDSLFRWELQVLEENRNDEDLYRADGFFDFIAQLLRIYESYGKKDYTETLQLICELEKKVDNIQKDRQCILHRIPRVFDHIIHVLRATILLHRGETTECLAILSEMTSLRDFNKSEEAAVFAIRSACYAMYSYSDIENALVFIDRAIRIDSETPFWRFLKAMHLYRARIAINPTDPPSFMELEILKQVNEDEKNHPLFMVYLADVLRESANTNKYIGGLDFWFIPHETLHTLKTESNDMFKEAKAMYEGAYKLRPECSVVGFRVANGLLKLPKQYSNVKLAKEIMEKHPEENRGYGNVVDAFYLHQFGKKSELAKRCLEAAMELNVFNAHINYIKLIFKEDPEKFEIEKLKKLLDKFHEPSKRKIIYAQLSSYYIFIQKNCKFACQYMMDYLKIGGARNSLERHVSCFVDTNEPFSLVDVVADQVKFSINMQHLQPQHRIFFEDFIHFTHFQNLSIDWKSRPQNLKRQILNNKIPRLKSLALPEPHANTNPWSGGNRAPNQTHGANKTQYSKCGDFSKDFQKNIQHLTNIVGPSNPNTNVKLSTQAPRQPNLSYPNKKQAPACSDIQNDRDGRNTREQKERRDQRSRYLSEASTDSDHDRRRRHKKKHRRHRSYSSSTSESDSRGRRRRYSSGSRGRKDHKKRHDKHRHRRYSSTSSDSSSSYDRYEKRGRRHDRRHSYTSSESDVSISERHGKKKSSRCSREQREDKNLRKRMEQMSMGDH